jgi:hypothetical protein
MLKAPISILRSTLGMCLALLTMSGAQTLYAQDAPPRIGLFVVDLRGMVPKFGDNPVLAQSRDLSQAELPGVGLGATGGVHLYLPKIVGITVGIGGEVLIGRSHVDPPGPTVDPTTGVSTPSTLRPVTETFKSISPQLSLNFGNGNGWSYLTAGLGRSVWSIVPSGANPLPADEEVLRTVNYGGGARWFIKKQLAFSLDVRFYDIAQGTPQLGFVGSPRTVLLVIGAGISFKWPPPPAN